MPRFLAFLLLFSAARAAENGTEEVEFIRVWPDKLVVEFGGSVILNCSSNCNGIGLETSLNQVSAGNGMMWKAFNLTDVKQWTSTPLCYANCMSKRKPQRAEITVYRAPEQVVLDPVPKMEVGKEYNLTCRVSNVAPIRNLIVTLLKGGQKLLVETFENHTAPEADEALATHKITAQQNDHKAGITCHAVLDLRPEGPLFEKASDNKSLVSVVFSTDPHLEASLSMETNTKMAVNCNVSGVFPAEEARFDLLFAGKSWNFSRSMSGASVSAQALVSSSSAGEHALICTVFLGQVSRTVEKMVNVYSLPKPILGIDQPKILVNRSVLITCRCNETGCSGTEMQISDSKHVLENGHPPFLQHALTTRKEDDGREFICRVAQMVDGHPVVKETSVHLTVFYGPQMNDSSCPTKLTWMEDSEETFTCSAQGNPPPTVECKKGDTSYNIGVQQRIYREHCGIYHCKATNDYGYEVRNVTIDVKYPQLNYTAKILIILGCIIIIVIILICVLKRFKKRAKYNVRKTEEETGIPLQQMHPNGDVRMADG